ncbi:prenylcysteine oxidase 1-like [Prorops nasuta]|uniref:prenylcysteine oxidase 1-like n=1 Tax=Prorops nasuta TaxID=863751 RepID=UPI0034CEBF68
MMKFSSILIVLHVLIYASNGEEKCQPKIAIIGAGIGGASASHFLTELFQNELLIDVYETNKIGGRLSTMKINNKDYEAGGSIIHPKNKYMQQFVNLIGLEKLKPNTKASAIWDGNQFLFEDSSWEVLTLAKLLYRYGFQPFRLYRYVNSILADFEKIYDLQDKGIPFLNTTSLLSAMNKDFIRLMQLPIKDHLLSLDYGEKLINELVQAIMVVNYGQETNIHSFVGAVAIAGADTGLWSVKGGNKKVTEHLLYKNKKVNIIPATVKEIHYLSSDANSFMYELQYINSDSENIMHNAYDIVIIASPLTKNYENHIKFKGFTNDIEIQGDYQTTVTTLVKGKLNPAYFGLNKDIDGILSCNPEKTGINSIGIINPADGTKSNSTVWKIFSRKSLDLNNIQMMFLTVDEVKEKVWKAYPLYGTSIRNDKFRLHKNLYHLNAIEWAASAMEMSAIGGRNVAILAHKEFSCFIESHRVVKKDLSDKRTLFSDEL